MRSRVVSKIIFDRTPRARLRNTRGYIIALPTTPINHEDCQLTTCNERRNRRAIILFNDFNVNDYLRNWTTSLMKRPSS